MKKYRYFISAIRKIENINQPLTYLDEFEDGRLNRSIRYYADGKFRCATPESGFDSEWFESYSLHAENGSNLEEDLKSDEDVIFVETNKEEFEREWKKVTSQPKFYLKPYSEYTEEDYKMRSI